MEQNNDLFLETVEMSVGSGWLVAGQTVVGCGTVATRQRDCGFVGRGRGQLKDQGKNSNNNESPNNVPN